MTTLIDTRPDSAVPLVFLDREGFAAWQEDASDFARVFSDSLEFSADFGKHILIPEPSGRLACVLVGLGNPPDDPRRTIHLFATLGRDLPGKQTYAFPEDSDFDREHASIGWLLAGYDFTRYKKKRERQRPVLYMPGGVVIRPSKRTVAAVAFARDLINTPAGDLSPSDLADRARLIAQRHEARLEIVEGDRLREQFPAIHAVGMGSHRAPKLIDLRWGDPANRAVTLVGKGVVFDSGGLDLKNASGMLLMKKDMGGAAMTMALADLIMASKLPVSLRLLVPAVENAIGPEAYRPGDVVETRSGKKVEIGNTDAEGRVILCDALTLAVEEKPDLIIDMATLTGACRIALGQDLPGYWTPDETIAAQIDRASRAVADPVWRMPLWLPYAKGLDSNIADLNNIAKGPMGGAVTAALYLHEFVRPFQNWVHFDIYAWRTESLPGSPKGGEASALRALFRFLSDRYGS